MRKKAFELTKGEEVIMELFWDADCPLTSMDICGMTDEFNDSYIHRLLTSLQKKEMLEVNGMVKSGKQYARAFVPAITREQYGAIIMRQIGINDEKALAKVAVAMVRQESDKQEGGNDELVKQLEDLVEQLKNTIN